MRLGNHNEFRFYMQQMVYVQRNYFIDTFHSRCVQIRSSFRRNVEDLCGSKVQTCSNSFL